MKQFSKLGGLMVTKPMLSVTKFSSVLTSLPNRSFRTPLSLSKTKSNHYQSSIALPSFDSFFLASGTPLVPQGSFFRFFNSISNAYTDENTKKDMNIRIPLVGTNAPDFTAECVKEDGTFSTITLSEFKGKKHVVLLFYPLNFTFVCPTEILAFSDASDLFHSRDTQVLGVSVDSVFCHNAWRNTSRADGGIGAINMPLVSDIDKKISRSYGVLLDNKISLRGLFVISKEDQKIKHQLINDLPFGRSVEECLRTIDMVEHVHKNEGREVCPANWMKEKSSMKATIEGMKNYIKQHHK